MKYLCVKLTTNGIVTVNVIINFTEPKITCGNGCINIPDGTYFIRLLAVGVLNYFVNRTSLSRT